MTKQGGDGDRKRRFVSCFCVSGDERENNDGYVSRGVAFDLNQSMALKNQYKLSVYSLIAIIKLSKL